MRILIPALLLCSFIFYACSSTKSVSVPQSESEITVDGNLSDWNLGQSLLDETDRVNYYVTRSDDFLYLYIDVRSLAMHQAIQQSGFIIYLSNDEDNRKKVGIGYPTGTFNLLREIPGQYRDFLRDENWMESSSNRRLLEGFQDDIFDRPMIVERYNGSSDADYGFVSKDQLAMDGFEIAANAERRLYGIEMRVPLDGSPIFEISDTDDIWVGFEIAPPNFRISSDQQDGAGSRYGAQGRHAQRGQDRGAQRQNMRRQLGQYEQWYLLQP